jgi:hypothetical protein
VDVHRPSGCPRRVRGQRGSATAEVAVVLPALVLVTALCVWAVLVVAVHVQCLDAARTGARALARDEPVAAVRAMVEASGPQDAEVEVVRLGPDLVAVQVRARVGLPGPWRAGPGVTVGGQVVAQSETSVARGRA